MTATTDTRQQAQSPASDVEGSLDPILCPRSVAVVGASRRPETIGNEILANLIRFGFTGPVFPVNPHAKSIRSVRAFPNVAAIGEPVDLAVLAVITSKLRAPASMHSRAAGAT